jgi:hypothetical protein
VRQDEARGLFVELAHCNRRRPQPSWAKLAESECEEAPPRKKPRDRPKRCRQREAASAKDTWKTKSLFHQLRREGHGSCSPPPRNISMGRTAATEGAHVSTTNLRSLSAFQSRRSLSQLSSFSKLSKCLERFGFGSNHRLGSSEGLSSDAIQRQRSLLFEAKHKAAKIRSCINTAGFLARPFSILSTMPRLSHKHK